MSNALDLRSLSSSLSADEATNALTHAAHALDHEYFGVFYRVDGSAPDVPAYHWEKNNLPGTWLQHLVESYSNEDRQADPLLQRLRRTSLPIAWDQDDYVAAGLGHRWEEMASRGIRAGVAVALHLPHGRHLCLGLNRGDGRASRDEPRLAADLMLLAVHALSALKPLCEQEVTAQEASQLTPREFEVLHWTAAGKTNWEIGRILGISEVSTARHVTRLLSKLNAINRTQAVLHAAKRGLL